MGVDSPCGGHDRSGRCAHWAAGPVVYDDGRALGGPCSRRRTSVEGTGVTKARRRVHRAGAAQGVDGAAPR